MLGLQTQSSITSVTTATAATSTAATRGITTANGGVLVVAVVVVVVVVVVACPAAMKIAADVATVEDGSAIRTMFRDGDTILFADMAFTLISTFDNAADSRAKLKFTIPAS